jgi:hypothetical protein
MTTINDLVPQGVLVRIANRIANSARQFARQTGSKRIPKAIKVGRVSATKDTASISIMLDTGIAPQALAFEHGAKPHPIYAVNAPNLVFEGTNEFAGKTIVTPVVLNHPGIAPRPFIKPAKERNREQNLKELREAVGTNIRLSIRAIAKKV